MWVLLLLPFIGLLWVPFHHAESALLGFPLFRSYRLAWVPVTALLTRAMYRAQRNAQRRRRHRVRKPLHTLVIGGDSYVAHARLLAVTANVAVMAAASLALRTSGAGAARTA